MVNYMNILLDLLGAHNVEFRWINTHMGQCLLENKPLLSISHYYYTLLLILLLCITLPKGTMNFKKLIFSHLHSYLAIYRLCQPKCSVLGIPGLRAGLTLQKSSLASNIRNTNLHSYRLVHIPKPLSVNKQLFIFCCSGLLYSLSWEHIPSKAGYG